MKHILPAIVIIVVIAGAVIIENYRSLEPSVEKLNVFASERELKAFLEENRGSGIYYTGALGISRGIASAEVLTSESFATAAQAPAPKAADYSTTNIQVAGVDEADFVKNDGEYIYLISNNKVLIMDAFPAEEMRIASEINLDKLYPTQLFVNGNRLVVFGSEETVYIQYGGRGGFGIAESTAIEPEEAVAESGEEVIIAVDYSEPTTEEKPMSIATDYYYPPTEIYSPKTFVYVYDVADRSNPVLLKNMTLDGSYFNSRMIGDYVYMITSQAVYDYENPVVPQPAYKCAPLEAPPCFSVSYFPVPGSSYQFTIVSAVNVKTGEIDNSKVFLLDYSQNMYVSQDNIYITYTRYVPFTDFLDKIVDAIAQLLPDDVQGKARQIQSSELFSNDEKMSAIGRILNQYAESLEAEERLSFQKELDAKMQEVQEEIAKETEKTVIQKIAISGMSIEHAASGEVPGNVLNQFSMDEFEGNLRIATTTNNWQAASKNHVYILDENLNIIGKLEDLAQGERIFSARFLGSRAYLVTFRQIDPLFVIDLGPAAPRVLGFLKIPGVSDYLHPYDDNHVIGVGRDATEEGRILGLKLSLFDASDPANPREISKYIIGEQGTSSEALNDHKAFLFNKEKQLLVIPVTEYAYRESGMEWSQKYGAYVFNINLEDGLTLKGIVPHGDTEHRVVDSYFYSNPVRRSLYMDDVLYTISQALIKANALGDLGELSEISLAA